MIVLNPNDTTHEVKIIPRIFNIDNKHNLNLTNEDTREVITQTHTKYIENGYIVYEFDYTFTDNQSFSVKIYDTDTDEIIWRGKLYVTDQTTQNYKING